jgi:hypothetical protein
VCHALFRLEPAAPLQDVVCPDCNSLALCVMLHDQHWGVPVTDQLLTIIAEALGILPHESPGLREMLDQDSVDLVNTVMELEGRGLIGDDPSSVMDS